MTDLQLIEGCLRMDRKAQRLLYERLAGKLYFTCKRYLTHQQDVEEVLADTVFIILTKIGQLKDPAALEGWARRISINQCLSHLRQRISFGVYLDNEEQHQHASREELPCSTADLLSLVDRLPEGCRTIFNLYAIEGFTHREIAEMLNISEGTSKSQLSFSRKKLQDLVHKFYDQSMKSHEQSR